MLQALRFEAAPSIDASASAGGHFRPCEMISYDSSDQVRSLACCLLNCALQKFTVVWKDTGEKAKLYRLHICFLVLQFALRVL